MERKSIHVFAANVFFFKIAGLWVPGLPHDDVSRFRKVCYIFYDFVSMLFGMVAFPALQIAMLGVPGLSFDEQIDIIRWIILYIPTVIKVIVWFWNKNKFVPLLNQVADYSFYVPVFDYSPDAIINSDKKLKNFLDLFYRIAGILVASSPAIFSLITLVTDRKQYVEYLQDEMNNTVMSYTQKLPFASRIPFNYSASVFRYASAVVFQFLGIVISATIIVSVDTIFLGLIYHSSTHLKLLQGSFNNLRVRCLLKLNLSNEEVLHDSVQLNIEMMKEMKSCIWHLKDIIRICEALEGILTYVFLMQVLCTQILVCSGLYVLSSVPASSPDFTGAVLFVFASNVQICLFCYYGNKVTERGDDISMSLFHSDWLSASKEFKLCVLMTMIRMKKKIYFTIGKFSPLTLATFVTIGRASYSLFAVLKKSNTQ